MEYNSIDCKSYNIHTIKTNRYKTTRIEVVFRLPAEKEKLSMYSFLAAMLNESSEKYPSRKQLSVELENLYKAYYYCYSNKIGKCLNTIFSLQFINPEYINETEYLERVISFLFEVILKPNVSSGEFNQNDFNIVKNEILLDIDSIEENAEKKAINSALKEMDNESLTSAQILGTKDDIEKINVSNLYDYYLKLINNANVDIFVIGNTNMNNIIKIIQQKYINHRIRNNKIEYDLTNRINKKVIKKENPSKFLQSQLVYICNLIDLSKEEKEVTFSLLNYILGSGGLSSKLYRYVREENSYCYQISSMYFKYDNLLCIASSLSKDNIDHSIKLIDKALREMKKGIFSDEDINDAKQNLLLSLNINKTNPSAILANYEFKIFNNNYSIEEKINLLEKITKSDIVTLANKIKLNTIYVLSEGKNE